MREYNADAFGGEAVPEFVHRFGPAYYAELVEFVSKCRSGQPFSVNQNDGLIAGKIAAAGMQSVSQDHSTVIDLS